MSSFTEQYLTMSAERSQLQLLSIKQWDLQNANIISETKYTWNLNAIQLLQELSLIDIYLPIKINKHININALIWL